MAEASGEIYDAKFYQEQKDESYRSARSVAPIIIEAVHPKTMVDVGCGVGAWARAFQDFGVDAYGVDGDYVDRSQLLIDQKKFFPHNLEEKIVINKKVDLVISMEVAEHLTPPDQVVLSTI